MKKVYIIALSIIFFIGCTHVEKQIYVKDKSSLSKPIRIAVLPFKDAPGKEGSGTIVAESLATEMIKISNWTIVERSNLDRILKEKKMAMTGLTDADYGKVAQILNADYLIMGSVSEFYYDRQYYIVPKTKLAFNARVIDARNGSIVATVTYIRETNKHAWVGCCLLSWYYLPLLVLSDENINADMRSAAQEVVKGISKDVEKKRGSCL